MSWSLRAPKAQVTKEKLVKFFKTENICAPHDAIKKVKRQPKEWEKIFANLVSDKGLGTRLYQEFF